MQSDRAATCNPHGAEAAMPWRANGGRSDRIGLREVARRGRFLWLAAAAVLLALGASVPLLYLPLMELAPHVEPAGDGPVAEGHIAIAGLCGLIVIFWLYTLLKRRELDRLREALEEEERGREALRTRLSELSTLFQVTAQLDLKLTERVLLELVLRRVVATTGAQQASIMLLDTDWDQLETRAAYGLDAERALGARVALGEGIAGHVARHDVPLLLGPEAPTASLARRYRPDRRITSSICLPLRAHGKCIGVLNINRIDCPGQFDDAHRDILMIFAEHIGTAIERARTVESIGAQTDALEADNRRLSEMNRMKDIFLSTATHELRTPLTTVIGYAELLHERDADLDSHQRQEFVRRLREEAGRLLGLIEDLLDLSRLESGKMTLQRSEVSLCELVREAIATTHALSQQTSVAVSCSFQPGLPQLSLDPVKVRQVLVNLIVNAIKFSPPRATVAVSVAQSGRALVVEVTDQGPGVSDEDAGRIFELFGQGVGSPSERKGSLGIGLHLVKRVCELHGGKVGVRGAPGGGSAFWVQLPVEGSTTGSAAPPQSRAEGPDKVAA